MKRRDSLWMACRVEIAVAAWMNLTFRWLWRKKQNENWRINTKLIKTHSFGSYGSGKLSDHKRHVFGWAFVEKRRDQNSFPAVKSIRLHDNFFYCVLFNFLVCNYTIVLESFSREKERDSLNSFKSNIKIITRGGLWSIFSPSVLYKLVAKNSLAITVCE